MTLDELKIELAHILAQEQELNWERVGPLSEATYVRLTTEPDTSQDFPHEDVIGYLAGFNRRRSDERFAAQQRQWLRSYLEATG